MTYDAIVVGAGHNGLVAACYLASAGLKTLVLEQRRIVGGAAVTEEFRPGYRVSSASYSLSLLRPDVYRDLGLDRHLDIRPKDPQTFLPLGDGRHFFIWRDDDRTVEEIGKISQHDADAYKRWVGFWSDAVVPLRELVDSPNPPPFEEVEAFLKERGRPDLWELAVAGSAADTVSRFFESDELRGVMASQGIIGVSAGPRDPGTAWVLAYHMLGGEVTGGTGTWAYVMGGMGAVTQALASVAATRGVEVLTEAQVTEILVDGKRAEGVRLLDGETIRSSVVLSNADPKATFLRLLPAGSLDKEFVATVDSLPMEGCVYKLNVALQELPRFLERDGIGPEHLGTITISPSIHYLETACNDARAGRYSSAPFIEAFIQTAIDPKMAPPGHHVMSAFTQYAPGTSWSQPSDGFSSFVKTMRTYSPNLLEAMISAEGRGPQELEGTFGLAGGDIFHGSLLPQHCFGNRFDYRTPIEGLYLCGSGARPGGGVMGAAGRNAARAVLSALVK